MRIRRCIENVCRTYGEERTSASGEKYYTFPKAEVIACLEDDDLKVCNLGYRSKYVVRAAKGVVAGEIDLQAIEKMKYAKAKEELLSAMERGLERERRNTACCQVQHLLCRVHFRHFLL